VPRSRLTDIFQAIYRIGDEYGLRIGNMCHAGDGVIHPQILFDSDDPQGPERAIACSRDILLACLEMGGSITGEHGVGVEKRGYIHRMYSAADLAHMIRLRDDFNPGGLLNPGKIFPSDNKDGETGSAISIPPGARE